MLYGIKAKVIFFTLALQSIQKVGYAHRSENVDYYFDEEGIYSHRKRDSSVNMSIIEEIVYENRDDLNACESYWIHQFIAWGFVLKNVVFRGASHRNRVFI